MADEATATHHVPAAPEAQSLHVESVRLQEPDPAQRPARLALYLGGALILLGAIALYLGYNGAALNPIPAAQTPYLISGGLTGAAMLLLGAIVIAMHVLLRVQADLRGELRQAREAIEQLSDAVSRQMFGGNGYAGSANGGASVMIARGSSSFHTAGCRLVSRAEHTRLLPREEAEKAGLLACRVCRP